MKKRGQVGIQFNWIFVIIAGALILAFFVMIVNRQKEISEKKLAAELLADLDMIITGQAVSPGSSKLLDMAELELGFTCEDYSIRDVPKTSGNAIIFSPSKMKGARLIAWTLEWAIPYRAANFIYLTVPEIKYYLIDPAENSGYDSFGIKSDFPETVDIEVLSNAPDEFEVGQRVRIVYFTTPPEDEPSLDSISEGLKKFRDDQVSVLYLGRPRDAGDFDGKTYMHFYRKNGDKIIKEKGPTPVVAIGKETVYGAIFTDDYGLYMCSIDKALKKLRVVTEIYRERVRYILEGLPLGDPCSPYYTQGPFDVIIESLTPPVNPANIFEAKRYIEKLNDRTIFASCPEIY